MLRKKVTVSPELCIQQKYSSRMRMRTKVKLTGTHWRKLKKKKKIMKQWFLKTLDMRQGRTVTTERQETTANPKTAPASCLEQTSRYVRRRRNPGQQSWEPREIKGLTFSGKGWEWRELHRHRAPWVLSQGSHTEQLPGRIRAVVRNWGQFYSLGAIWLSGDIFGL